jgi:prophage regulatory protein
MKQDYDYPVYAPATPSNRVLSNKEVIRKASLSRSTIYDYIRRGIFPAPIKIGLKRVGWLESEVDDWLDKRRTQSRLGLNNG